MLAILLCAALAAPPPPPAELGALDLPSRRGAIALRLGFRTVWREREGRGRTEHLALLSLVLRPELLFAPAEPR